MLIQFRVENHRSLRDEQVLNMVAADLGDAGSERLIHVDGFEHGLLPAVALYGANASGKSNVIGALSFMQSAVLESHRLWDPEGGTPQDPFALSAKVNDPSLYEVDVLLEGTRLRYGFVLSAARVEEEWLYAWPRGRKQLWFEREGDTFRFAKALRGENEAIRALTRPNSLFLSAAAQNNHEAMSPIFRWFADARFNLRRGSATPTNAMFASSYFKDLLGVGWISLLGGDESSRERQRQAFVRLLQAADIGVLDIKLEPKEPEPQAPAVSRAGFLGEVRSHDRGVGMKARGGSPGPGKVRMVAPGSRGMLGAPRAMTASYEYRFRHQTEDSETEVWLPLSEESAGTITLFGLAVGLLYALERGDLLVIDELESSLHPMLALEIVRLFNDPTQNPRGAQLIFTTHDTNLLGGILDEPALRRDQVWFTEKDRGGATHLYPLTDFEPRKEENLERGYLQGRYGAIPFLGRLVSAPEKTKKRKG